MDRATLEALSAETLALLRQHNLLMPLMKAEVIKAAVGSIPVSKEDEAELLMKYCEQRGLEPGEQLDKHLLDTGLTRECFTWQICLERRIVAYSEMNYIHKAEARFLAKKEHLDQVVYSLLRVKDPLLARELYLRIDGNEADFNDLASKFSEGQERNTKGIVGPAPLAQAHPILADRLRTARPGKLLEPFQIEHWWLVVRLERFAPSRFKAETAVKMARELFQEWVTEQSAVKMKELNQGQFRAELHDGNPTREPS